MKRTMLGLICTQILFLAACGSINTSNTINVNDEKDGYEETVTSEAENDNSLITLIADFLKESESEFFPKLKYGFHDIDLDGKKELLMAGSDSHVNRVKVIRIDYDNNELIDLGDYGCWGCIQYSSENGYIDDCYTGQGVTEGTIYDISTNSPRKVLEYYDDSGVDEDESNDVYKLNGKEVSREEYEGEIFFSLQIHDYSQLVNIGYDDFEENISLDVLKEKLDM